MDTLSYVIRKAADWLFLIRAPGLVFVRAGVALLIAALAAGLVFSFDIATASGRFKLSFDSGSGVPLVVTIIALIVAVILIARGIQIYRQHVAETGRARVLVLELRGLRDVHGQPLADGVPERIHGRREAHLIDVRQNADGTILDPDIALGRLQAIQATIGQYMAGRDRADMTIVAGGLAPVPYTFLLGVMLDDEGVVEILDWDRGASRWRELHADDDGKRFEITGAGTVSGMSECVLAVSFSYPADAAGIAAAFPGLPAVELKMPVLTFDGHWSSAKQDQLAQQFLAAARDLAASGVKRIHCITAAPSSLVLRFGRIYDKRNLPRLSVYQYDQRSDPPYPWGLAMPVGGAAKAEIIRRPPDG